MNLIIKIAWRNIFRHKGKSMIIGAILFLGALLMTVGNGVISGMDKGLQQTVVNSFTGDLVLIPDKHEGDNVFFEMMGKALDPITNYMDIKKVLTNSQVVDRALPIGKNMAMVLNEDGGMPGNAYLVGVDFEKYEHMFPGNIKVLEGRMLNKSEKGSLVPTGARNEFFDFTNIWFKPDSGSLDTANLTADAKADRNNLSIKNNAVLMGFNQDNSSTDIRLPIKGIIEYKALNRIWGHFVIIDIESYRQCLGYFTANDKTAEVTAEQKSLFTMDNVNLDAMFATNSLLVKNTAKKPEKSGLRKADTTTTVDPKKNVDIDEGAYNLVLVVIKKGVSLDQALVKLNKIFTDKKLGVRAVFWKNAIGPLGSMATIIKGALFVFVMFLFFVAIIIIVNTLSMAALERTTEIGMMRAVGAKKSFISWMFLGETAMLSFFFGGLGIAVGIIVVNILAMLNITSDNDIVQLMFGGDRFHPLLTLTDIVLAIVQLSIVTLIAVVYPVRVARDITPLDAISKD